MTERPKLDPPTLAEIARATAEIARATEALRAAMTRAVALAQPALTEYSAKMREHLTAVQIRGPVNDNG